MYHVLYNPYPNMKLWSIPISMIEDGTLPKEGFADYQLALNALNICENVLNEPKPQLIVAYIRK